ncbi:MAG: GxxExxY protein [Verrucomicrobiota bacterium]
MSSVNLLSHEIIGAAMRVHTALGPGLLESSYEACLEYELKKLHFVVDRQIHLPLRYDNVSIDCGYRIDLMIEKTILIEIKAVEILNPIHEAQLLTYLKLSKLSLGLLINFHVSHLRHGIKRLVHHYREETKTLTTEDITFG